MYIKKGKGPLLVKLDDGTILSRGDLPPVETCRWVASRKAAVVRGVTSGLISKEEACERYSLSEEELDGWIARAETYGEHALRATALHKYRQP